MGEHLNGWEIECYKPKDQSECLKLFKASFGFDMQPSLWNWKYPKNSKAVVARKNERIIAYYGGIPRELLVRSAKLDCIQISDTMVSPDSRGFMTKNGVFTTTATEFINLYIGANKSYRFAFGFPSGRHATLGKKLGIYDIVDEMNELSWIPSKSNLLFLQMEEIEIINSKIHINNLWNKLEQTFKNLIIGVKNSNFFESRYAMHPTGGYLAFAIKRIFGKEYTAILIVKEHKESLSLEILDILAEEKRIKDVVQIINNYAMKKGFTKVFMWGTPSIEKALPANFEKVKICDICITISNLDYKIENLSKGWFMMAGDTDFR